MIVTHVLRIGLTVEGLELLTDEASAMGVVESYNEGSPGRKCIEGRTRLGTITHACFDMAQVLHVATIEIDAEARAEMAKAQSLSVVTEKPSIVRPQT
jgi:hypothetical protein